MYQPSGIRTLLKLRTMADEIGDKELQEDIQKNKDSNEAEGEMNLESEEGKDQMAFDGDEEQGDSKEQTQGGATGRNFYNYIYENDAMNLFKQTMSNEISEIDNLFEQEQKLNQAKCDLSKEIT